MDDETVPQSEASPPSFYNVMNLNNGDLSKRWCLDGGADVSWNLKPKGSQRIQLGEAVTDQATARYYQELNAYAIQTGGTVRPLSGFNVGGAQNKPTSYVEEAGFRADQLIYDFGQTAHTVLAERVAGGD